MTLTISDNCVQFERESTFYKSRDIEIFQNETLQAGAMVTIKIVERSDQEKKNTQFPQFVDMATIRKEILTESSLW